MQSTTNSTHLNKQKTLNAVPETLNAVPETLNAVLSIIVNMPNNLEMVKLVGSITRQLDKKRKKLVNGTQQNTPNEETNKKFQTYFNKMRYFASREFIPIEHLFEHYQKHKKVKERLINIYKKIQELTNNIEIESINNIISEAQNIITNINKNYTFTKYKNFFYDKKGHFNTKKSIKQHKYVNYIVRYKEKIFKLKIEIKILLDQIIEKLKKLKPYLIREFVNCFKKLQNKETKGGAIKNFLQRQNTNYILEQIRICEAEIAQKKKIV